MFKEIFRNIEGIDILPNITLVIFFIVFIALVIYTLKLDKRFVDYMGRLPLDNDNFENNKKENINGSSN